MIIHPQKQKEREWCRFEILNFFRFKILFSFSFLWTTTVFIWSFARTPTLSLPCKGPYTKVRELADVVFQLAASVSIIVYSSDFADSVPDSHSSSYLGRALPFLGSDRPRNAMNSYGSPKSCRTQKCWASLIESKTEFALKATYKQNPRSWQILAAKIALLHKMKIGSRR